MTEAERRLFLSWSVVDHARIVPGDLAPFYASTAGGVLLTYALVIAYVELHMTLSVVLIVNPQTYRVHEIRTTWGRRLSVTEVP